MNRLWRGVLWVCVALMGVAAGGLFALNVRPARFDGVYVLGRTAADAGMSAAAGTSAVADFSAAADGGDGASPLSCDGASLLSDDGASLLSDGGRVNVNEADKEALCALNGVGPALAERIIRERETNGRFSYPEDLLTVSGIGRKTLEKLLDQMELD